MRDDTGFSQTVHLDRCYDKNVKFIFGINAIPNLENMTDNLPEGLWRLLLRSAKYEVRTEPRQKRAT